MNSILRELFDNNNKLAVAVSGGADSMALLHMTMRASNGRKFCAFTINHHIREEATEDAGHVINFCAENNIPVRLYNVFIKAGANVGVEFAAREARREIYRRVIGEFDYVLLAHHANDNAESVLMHILRGAGLRGARGIEALDESTRLVRPLLNMTRGEIEDYCAVNGIPYVFDRTNADCAYTRNYLRNKIFPLLKRVNEGFLDNINAFARLAAEDDDCLNGIAEGLLIDGTAAIELGAFNSAAAPVKGRAVMSALKRAGVFSGIEARHIEAVRVFAAEGGTGGELHLPDGIKVIKDYGALLFSICNNDRDEKSDLCNPTPKINVNKSSRDGGNGMSLSICDGTRESLNNVINFEEIVFCEGIHKLGSIEIRVERIKGVRGFTGVSDENSTEALCDIQSCDKASFAENVCQTACIEYVPLHDLTFTRKPLYFNIDLIPKNAVIRFRREGDVFKKFGGGTKKLKDYFIDKKISRRIRDVIPLICNGKEVLLICGMEISQGIKITEATINVAEIRVLYPDGLFKE